MRCVGAGSDTRLSSLDYRDRPMSILNIRSWLVRSAKRGVYSQHRMVRLRMAEQHLAGVRGAGKCCSLKNIINLHFGLAMGRARRSRNLPRDPNGHVRTVFLPSLVTVDRREVEEDGVGG